MEKTVMEKLTITSRKNYTQMLNTTTRYITRYYINGDRLFYLQLVDETISDEVKSILDKIKSLGFKRGQKFSFSDEINAFNSQYIISYCGKSEPGAPKLHFLLTEELTKILQTIQ